MRPRPVGNLTSTAWVVERMRSFDGLAKELVPGPFDAYARILHRPDQGMPDGDSTATWRQVADRRGTTVHAAAQWDYLAGWAPDSCGTGGDRSRDVEPLVGSLDPLTLPLLCKLLARHTSAPQRCWLALWVGFGRTPAGWADAPAFRLPGREYWLFESSLDAVTDHAIAFAVKHLAADDPRRRSLLGWGHVQSPQLWWPEDRAWAVASEIDYNSTIVGGSVSLVETLVSSEIEALRIDGDTSLYFDADRVNRRPT